MRGYRKAFLKRVFLLIFAALAITQILPSLADEITPNPVPDSTQSPAPTPTIEVSAPAVIDTRTSTADVKASASPVATPTQSGVKDNSQIIPEFIALPAPPKPRFADRQSIIFKAPGRYLVDPRATSAQLAPLQISSGELVLVCLSAPGRSFNVAVIRGDISMIGNGTGLLSIAGSASSISSLFNTASGIRVASNQRISPSQVEIGMGVLTDLPDDQLLCSDMPINQKLNISPLGLTTKMVKNRIQIK